MLWLIFDSSRHSEAGCIYYTPIMSIFSTSRDTGNHAENIACDYLKNKKYRVLARNYRVKIGEIDIIAQDPGEALVFVEVKSLRVPYGDNISESRIFPEEHMTHKKYKTISKVAEIFCAKHDLANIKEMRIDLIAVDLAPDGSLLHIRHIENALSENSEI